MFLYDEDDEQVMVMNVFVVDLISSSHNPLNQVEVECTVNNFGVVDAMNEKKVLEILYVDVVKMNDYENELVVVVVVAVVKDLVVLDDDVSDVLVNGHVNYRV
jgi:hypothetical protein